MWDGEKAIIVTTTVHVRQALKTGDPIATDRIGHGAQSHPEPFNVLLNAYGHDVRRYLTSGLTNGSRDTGTVEIVSMADLQSRDDVTDFAVKTKKIRGERCAIFTMKRKGDTYEYTVNMDRGYRVQQLVKNFTAAGIARRKTRTVSLAEHKTGVWYPDEVRVVLATGKRAYSETVIQYTNLRIDPWFSEDTFSTALPSRFFW